MADSATIPRLAAGVSTQAPTHTALVRVTHWITALCFFALLVSGVELVISHPRFYWGETGNSLMPALFQLPIPASRAAVPTGYNYVLPDQNGWSRSLHFQSAWLVILTGLLYGGTSMFNGHLRKRLLPTDLSWTALSTAIGNHLRFRKPAETTSYNILQQIAYLGVIFVAFPLMIWTGLAMSPAIMSTFPGVVTTLGGQQSARTLHFFTTLSLILFLLVHIIMVCLAGFGNRMRAMTIKRQERP